MNSLLTRRVLLSWGSSFWLQPEMETPRVSEASWQGKIRLGLHRILNWPDIRPPDIRKICFSGIRPDIWLNS